MVPPPFSSPKDYDMELNKMLLDLYWWSLFVVKASNNLSVYFYEHPLKCITNSYESDNNEEHYT